MVSSEVETIAALATPIGKGGVGIVRISGPEVSNIAHKMLGKLPKPRFAEHLRFLGKHQELIDQGLALFFKGPHSFTGEDVLELHGHGGPFVMQRLLKAAMGFGARLATPGEFSLRAYLNNKIDLVQAESIAELINAASEQAAKYAARSLQGDFSRVVHAWIESLIKLRMWVETAIDFPEEELDFLSDGSIQAQVSTLLKELKEVLLTARQGALLTEGLRVVIAGKPNAGKSSLLNRLAGKETAIVTDIPGTTRDVLRETICLDGLLLHVVDTAGLRESSDRVEELGIKRAQKEIREADHLLWVVDVTLPEEEVWNDIQEGLQKTSSAKNITVVLNKVDDLHNPASFLELFTFEMDAARILLSAKTGEGMEALCQRIKETAGFNLNDNESVWVARGRQVDALTAAEHYLESGLFQLCEFKAGELLAEDLRAAQQALEEITGKFSSDDLLGRIFSEFCIGK